MNILIVEDEDEKAIKIKTVITEILSEDLHTIEVRTNNADAMAYLRTVNEMALMILDLNLPVREGEYAKKKAGLQLLNEIIRRKELVKPEAIIGLTLYTDVKELAQTTFDREGWALISYDPKYYDWEETIKNKISWLLQKQQTALLPSKTKILFVASSPEEEAVLNPGMEQRRIEEALQLSTLRDHFLPIFKHGAKLETLTRELMQHNPEILHFSGHAHHKGIGMETDNGDTNVIPNDALGRLFGLYKGVIKIVVLSACYSSTQAQMISKFGIYVVGMNDEIHMTAATEFSKGFYQALGEGKDVEQAFSFGMVHLTSYDTAHQSIPELWLNGKIIS
jgi:CheY-like chemotaxis protein